MSLRALLGFGAARKAAALEKQIEAGIRCFDDHDLAGAQQAFDAVLKRAPDHPRALGFSGAVRLAAGDPGGAERLLRHAIEVDPAGHLAWFNLGNALAAQGRLAEALQAFTVATERAPDHFPAWFNLARARADAGDDDAAMAAWERCIALRPRDATALVEFGMARFRKGAANQSPAELDAAIALLEQALAQPDIPPAPAHNARLFLGDALARRGRRSEALALFRGVQAAAPDDLDANVNLANCLNTMGRIRDAAPYYERVVRLFPAHLPAISSAISAADYAADFQADDNARWRRELMRHFADPQRATTWPNSADPGRRLRIGYVSPDFREHVAMTLMEGVLAHHDRREFEIHVYDATAQRDERNRSLRVHADHWREIDTLGTAEAARLVAADGIDILVDLAGHTAGNRLMVFARKPAPIQATWLAYPGSTGLPEIDYIVSDPHTTPERCDCLYSEAVWRLPDTRFCFMPPAGSPEPRLPGAGRPITFASFNNPSKLNPRVLGLWQRILERLPDARLLLKYAVLDDPAASDWLRAELAAAGIAPAQVELRGWSTYVEALDQYADTHVALDPFPFCGGLTSLDALWMGVPVVTLAQRQMAGRQTEAFLHNLGAGELVAGDPDAYVEIAVALAQDRHRLAAYRSGLRAAMRASALFNHAGFTRNLEAALRGMWRRWCESRRAAEG